MSSHDFIYRMVLDDFTRQDVGVIRLDIKNLKDTHWIVDHNGYLRRCYHFRTIDKADYDVVTSFETHPELTVKYRRWTISMLKNLLEGSWILLLLGAIISISMFIIMGSTIYFVDDPNAILDMKKNPVFKITFLIGLIKIGMGLPISILSIYSDYIFPRLTKRDKQIERWNKEK